MALVLADRVRETTTVTGTGTATLLGAVSGYQSFSAVGNANTTYYVIANQSATEWEVGIGTYTASGTLLSRDTVLSSSNSGSLVNFSAGTKDVFVDYPAGRAVYEDAAGNVDGYPITGGTINNTTIGATTPSTGVFTTLTAQNETLKGTGQNFFLYSEQFQQAAWSQGGASVTADATTAPNGTNTADKIIGNVGILARKSIFQAFTPTNGPKYTFSVYLKAAERTTATIWLDSVGWVEGSYYGAAALLDLSTGVSSAPSQVSMTSVGNGWYRCAVTGTSSSSLSCNAAIAIGPANGGDYTGNGVSGIYVWGAQVELASTAGSYLVTTTTAVYGTPTLSFSGVASIGLQSDGSLYETSAGTGNVRFYTNNIAQEQMRVSHTASAVNYVQVTGAATGNSPAISAQGSDANVNLLLNPKGSGQLQVYINNGSQFRVSNTASAVNYLEAKGNIASNAPILSAQGSDTNIDLNLTTKGTGAVNLNTGSNVQLKATEAGVTNTSWTEVQGGISATKIYANGSGSNIEFRASSKGTSAVALYTNAQSQLQLNVAHTASAVNYVQVTGGATGNAPYFIAQGSDTNVNLWYGTKGTGYHAFFTAGNGSNVQFLIADTASAVNYVQTSGSTTGFGAKLFSAGSDTNINLVLQPKGTGALQAQQTDSTATGGNARGANAVDWQTLRNGAGQVASGQNSFIGGGGYSTAAGAYSSVVTGFSNTANATVACVLSGQSNVVVGNYAVIAGGVSNAASGWLNFIGGGFTNSGTANAAVTTQSATMNGTTAVTLSGSNASIKVGQYITGTSIAADTYVAAVSGTSLTLSKVASGSSTSTLSFFTPHGVVVGGGNNQATGAYSFIGGGGDAGTAANRNVASGDWSVVGGGRVNQATGVASFVGGGGFEGSNLGTNLASGTCSSVMGGFQNTASGVGSAVTGGFQNIANSTQSTCVGGRRATTRSIIGNTVFSASENPIADAQGVSQAALLVLAVQTTDATATVLRSNTQAASTTNQVILPNNSAYYFKVEIIANVTGGGNTSGWELKGVIKRGANAASTTIVGSVTSTLIAQDAGASTWAVSATADTTNGGLKITCTGQASTTIRWVAKASTTEVTF